MPVTELLLLAAVGSVGMAVLVWAVTRLGPAPALLTVAALLVPATGMLGQLPDRLELETEVEVASALSKVVLLGLFVTAVPLWPRIHRALRDGGTPIVWWTAVAYGLALAVAGARQGDMGFVHIVALPGGVLAGISLATTLGRDRALDALMWVGTAVLGLSLWFGLIGMDTVILGDSRRFDWTGELFAGELASGRLIGVTIHPNRLGIVGAVVLALALASTRSRPVRMGVAALAVVTVLASESRTSMSAVAAVLILVPLLRTGRGQVGVGLRLVAASAVVLAVALPFWVALSEEEVRPETPEGEAEIQSLNNRRPIWGASRSAIREEPVWGYGPGNFWDDEFNDEWGLADGLYGDIPHAHNQLHQAAGEAGVVGLVAFASFGLAVLVVCWKERWRSNGLALAVLVIGFLEANLESIFSLEILVSDILLVAVIGALAVPRHHRPDAAGEELPQLAGTSGR